MMSAAPTASRGIPRARPGGRVLVEGVGLRGNGDSFPQRSQVAGMQRTRLLAGAVSAVDELGYVDATVAQITARARISRRTFYELFDNREDCFVALLDDALERARHEIAAASLDHRSWRERVSGGLWGILSFFDREPALARVCLVQAARGSDQMLARRTEILARLAATIDEGRNENLRGAETPPLTAEGLVGAAHSIVYERVLRRSAEPLTGLHAALMSMIVLPYLGAAAARREQTRPSPSSIVPPEVATREVATAGDDPLRGLPMRLTYRTIRVLYAIAETPGISNRQVGDQAGVADQGQISKLLTRLERLGLVANSGEGHNKGEPNVWRLTPRGEQVTQSINEHASNRVQAA